MAFLRDIWQAMPPLSERWTASLWLLLPLQRYNFALPGKAHFVYFARWLMVSPFVLIGVMQVSMSPQPTMENAISILAWNLRSGPGLVLSNHIM